MREGYSIPFIFHNIINYKINGNTPYTPIHVLMCYVLHAITNNNQSTATKFIVKTKNDCNINIINTNFQQQYLLDLNFGLYIFELLKFQLAQFSCTHFYSFLIRISRYVQCRYKL